MSEIKLKPCPFCGEEAILKRDRIGLYCAKCTNCGCMTTFQFDFGEGEEASKRKEKILNSIDGKFKDFIDSYEKKSKKAFALLK